ncbi:MAG: hypothetical protein JXA82_14330 [Sedimentisphaerales bacterium]|nr:hypothetical protein [Sedimentisphaerales bacterium]
MQKLVTIYIDSMAYMSGKWIRGSYADKHGFIEEHLGEYLSAGWTIRDIHSFGGAAESLNVRGWIIVLLERQE